MKEGIWEKNKGAKEAPRSRMLVGLKEGREAGSALMELGRGERRGEKKGEAALGDKGLGGQGERGLGGPALQRGLPAGLAAHRGTDCVLARVETRCHLEAQRGGEWERD